MRRVSRRLVNRRVLVSLLSGNAVGGVCVLDCPDAVVVRGAVVHSPGADPAQADGDVLIDRINIDFIQLL